MDKLVVKVSWKPNTYQILNSRGLHGEEKRDIFLEHEYIK